MGTEFFQTVMGRRFIEGTMPSIARSLEKIASSLEQQQPQTGIFTSTTETPYPPVKVIQLLCDAVSTDGAHHKQWYLEQIAEELGHIVLPEHEEGITP